MLGRRLRQEWKNNMAKREYIQANKDWLEAKSKEEGVKALPKGIKVPSTYRGMRIVYKYDDGFHDDFNVSEELLIEYYD